MNDIGQAVERLDLPTIRDVTADNNIEGQGDLFHCLIRGLKDRPSTSVKGRQMVYLLNLAGADINRRNELGNTALHQYLTHASADVDPTVVEAFLRCNADPYIPNNEGRTAFSLAFFNPKLSKILKGVFMKYVPGIWRAVEGDDVMNVRKLINQWSQVDVKKDGKSLQQFAKEVGSENIVRVVRDIKSSMDFAHAVLATDVSRVSRTLKGPATVNINFRNMGDRGATPLYYAILNNDLDVIEELLRHGARADIPMNEGDKEIPLFLATLSSEAMPELSTLLHVVDRLPKGVVNKMFYCGNNILMHSIEQDVPTDVVRRILTKGGAALITCRDECNYTARDAAARDNKGQYVELIDEMVSQWIFKPSEGDVNRRLLCLHGYPYLASEPLCHSDVDIMVDSEISDFDTDMFLHQLPTYMQHIQRFHNAVEDNDVDAAGELLYLEQYSKRFEPCLADSRCVANFQPALHKAVLRRNMDIARLLVEASLYLQGQRLDSIRDQFHRTALYYCSAAEHSNDLTSFVTENGASEHVMDKDGRSPQVFKDRRGQPLMEEFLRYHILQDFSHKEPDPWSVPLPLPIVGYMDKCAHGHEHGQYHPEASPHSHELPAPSRQSGHPSQRKTDEHYHSVVPALTSDITWRADTSDLGDSEEDDGDKSENEFASGDYRGNDRGEYRTNTQARKYKSLSEQDAETSASCNIL